MVKGKKGGAGAASSSKKKTRIWQAIFAVLVVGAMLTPSFLKDRGSSDSDQAVTGKLPETPIMRDRLALPAAPRNPRPRTLNPAAYTDPEIRKAYQVAQDDPEALEHVACYCGCFGNSNHRNNLDCFKDSHGET